MKRAMMLSAMAVALLWAGSVEAQYYSVYYPYTSGYYTSAPTTTYYGAATTTTYYASSPTTVYYGAAPTTTYYASRPTTVYYGAPPTTVYYSAPPVMTYRPLVGRGITRVGYYTPAYPAAYQAYYPAW